MGYRNGLRTTILIILAQYVERVWAKTIKDCIRYHEKNRSNYHYKLRALRKNKQNKIKLSVSKTMLRNSSTTYRKSTHANCKHNYITTQMIDGTSGDSNIANIFRRKYKSLFNSVEYSDKETSDLSQRIQSAVTAECECTIKTSDESNHCHMYSKLMFQKL